MTESIEVRTRGLHIQPLNVIDVYVPEGSTVITVRDVDECVQLMNELMSYDEDLTSEEFEVDSGFIAFHIDEFKEGWLRFTDTFWIKYTI